MTNKLHYFKLEDQKIKYICNPGCRTSNKNITNDYFKVNCPECKEILVKERIKMELVKRTQKIIDMMQDYSKQRKEELSRLEGYDEKHKRVRINEVTNFEESVITRMICDKIINPPTKIDAVEKECEHGN